MNALTKHPQASMAAVLGQAQTDLMVQMDRTVFPEGDCFPLTFRPCQLYWVCGHVFEWFTAPALQLVSLQYTYHRNGSSGVT